MRDESVIVLQHSSVRNPYLGVEQNNWYKHAIGIFAQRYAAILSQIYLVFLLLGSLTHFLNNNFNILVLNGVINLCKETR